MVNFERKTDAKYTTNSILKSLM